MNAGREPLFVLDQDCLAITNRVVQEVEAAGMKTLRSFDLDIVRSENPGFCCPIHGKSICTCQLVVLLIMPRGRSAITVVLEGRDQQTWIYLDSGQVETDEQVDPFLTGALLHAFFSGRQLR